VALVPRYFPIGGSFPPMIIKVPSQSTCAAFPRGSGISAKIESAEYISNGLAVLVEELLEELLLEEEEEEESELK
jgi:hypothetical protein